VLHDHESDRYRQQDSGRSQCGDPTRRRSPDVTSTRQRHLAPRSVTSPGGIACRRAAAAGTTTHSVCPTLPTVKRISSAMRSLCELVRWD